MKAENERVEIHELRGFMSSDLLGAFNEMHAISRATLCQQFMYSLSLNPPKGEGGDGIAFVRALTSCSFVDVPDVVARVAGGAVAVTHARVSSAANISRPNISQIQKQEIALKIWNECKPLSESMLAQSQHPLALYLKRRGIVAQALQSSDIAFHPKLWHGQTQSTHPALVALMRDVAGKGRAMAQQKSGLVFTSVTSASGHLEEPKNAWKRILQRAGIEDLRIHDLRRTLGSYQAITGASGFIIGKSLGHKSSAATAI